MYTHLLVISIVLIALSLIGLSIQILFSKKKQFPQTHIGHNKDMKKLNIHCVKTEQLMIDLKYNNTCSGCCSATCDE